MQRRKQKRPDLDLLISIHTKKPAAFAAGFVLLIEEALLDPLRVFHNRNGVGRADVDDVLPRGLHACKL